MPKQTALLIIVAEMFSRITMLVLGPVKIVRVENIGRLPLDT
jgi:hypothetical protein